MHTTVPFLLASSSPRRRHLLEVLGMPFSVVSESVSEDVDPLWSPVEVVENLALRKARAVARSRDDAIVLGSDTIVVLDNTVLGKPADAAEAATMLETLSGRTHEVYTGLALVYSAQGRQAVSHEVTHVTFAKLDRVEIDAYVASGSPLDKAGAYGIQEDLGATFVSSVNGDYYTVVGLP
ncbi:MAG: Maf family protein, partial [Rhodothermales bacterium]|nr:Maf family protein [Rhodothermales bacterium]